LKLFQDQACLEFLLFEEQEGSYLVGAIAAQASKTGKIGFIGGMDIPLIRRFQTAFQAGAQAQVPKIQVTNNSIGITGEAWNNPAKAKELALAQYSSGVDVIFVAAGASANGVFDAAEESKKLAIGCDSNQDWMKPGFILTSMLKRVDVAVFDTIKAARDGQFKGGVEHFGLQSQGVDYSVDSHNEKVFTPALRQMADELKKKIIAGSIQVPDYYKMKK